MDKDIKKLLSEFLRNASIDDIYELYALLEEREKKQKRQAFNLNLDLDSMAKNMSKQIEKQLGMSNLNIKKMAQDLVVQLAIQYKPDITTEELNAILSQMVPDKRTDIAKKIPSDILITMVAHFIESDINSGIEWKKRYWEVFPEEIKLAIAMFLRGDISKDELFKRVYLLLSEKNGTMQEKKTEKKKRGMPLSPNIKNKFK